MVRSRRLVRIQDRGQVTLPVELRRQLNLKKGDLVSVENSDGLVVIRPQRPERIMTEEQEAALFATPSAEEIARRQALMAEILANRKDRDIRPLTAADLVHMAREDATWYGDDNR